MNTLSPSQAVAIARGVYFFVCHSDCCEPIHGRVSRWSNDEAMG